MVLTILTILFLILFILVIIGLYFKGTDWGNPVVNVIDGLFRLYLRYYHRFNNTYIDLPAQGAALVVSNHISGLDPFLIMGASKRPIRFMIAMSEYQRFGLRWLFRAAGCIPVERSGKPEQALRYALNALKEGEVVGIFPEGGIPEEDEPPKRLKRGVAVLADQTGAPVYPVTVGGVGAEREVVKAVFKRGRPYLNTHPPIVDCTETGQQACLDRLAAILSGDSTNRN